MRVRQKNNSLFSKVVGSVLSKISGDQKADIVRKALTPEILRVFEDKELIGSVEAFFANDLNVSETSRSTFMHRNTLLYRIAKIRRIAKVNVRNFEDAVAFNVLHIMYKDVYKKL